MESNNTQPIEQEEVIICRQCDDSGMLTLKGGFQYYCWHCAYGAKLLHERHPERFAANNYNKPAPIPADMEERIKKEAMTLYNDLDSLAAEVDTYQFGLPYYKNEKLMNRIESTLKKYAALQSENAELKERIVKVAGEAWDESWKSCYRHRSVPFRLSMIAHDKQVAIDNIKKGLE